MSVLRRHLETSAARWGLSRGALPWVFWTPVLGAVLLALARLDKEVYRFLLTEDGPIEWAQFACFAIACLAAAGISAIRWAAGRRWQGLLFACLAAATFFLAGEEIAWGQRIFGLETPESLREINQQEEITLHNVGGILDVLNVVMLGIGLTGFLLAVWGRRLRLERLWDRADFLFVPPLFLAPCFLMLFLYKVFRFTVWVDSGFTITKYGEWFELCLAFGLALFLWLNYRLLVRERRNGGPPAPADSRPAAAREETVAS